MNFKENLARFRKQAGMSQEDLADKLQLTRQTISKWETGLSEPDLATLQQLCRLLQVTPDELLLGKKKELPASSASEKKRREVYEIFFYIFLIVIFIAAVATLNSDRSVLTRQRQAIYVMGACVVVFLLIGLVKGVVKLVQMGVRMLQNKKK